MQQHHIIFNNIRLSAIGNILYLASRLCIIPFILKYVSLAEYGVWICCFIFINYLNTAVLGVTSGYIHFTSKYSSQGEWKKLNSLITTGMCTLGLFAIVSLIITYFCIPILFPLLNMPDNLTKIAKILFLTSLVATTLEISFNAFGNILNGLQKIAKEQLHWILGFSLEIVLTILLLLKNFGVYSLAIAYGLRVLLQTTLNAYACIKHLPDLKIGLQYLSLNSFKKLLHFGGTIQCTSLAAIVNSSFAKIVAGFSLGPAGSAIYDLGEKMPKNALRFSGIINKAIFPALSRLHAKNQTREAANLLLQSTRHLNLFTGLSMAFLATFANAITTAWLGPKNEHIATILCVFTIALHTHMLTAPISSYYRAIQKPIKEFIFNLNQTILIAIFFSSFWFATHDIFLAINSSLFLALTLTSFLYLMQAKRTFALPSKDLWQGAILPGILPYAIALTLRQIMVPTGPLLFLLFAIYFLLTASSIYLILKREERKRIREFVTLRIFF